MKSITIPLWCLALSLPGCSAFFPKGASYDEVGEVARDVCDTTMRAQDCFDAIKAHARELQFGAIHAAQEAEWKCPAEMAAPECLARLEGRGK